MIKNIHTYYMQVTQESFGEAFIFVTADIWHIFRIEILESFSDTERRTKRYVCAIRP